MAIYDYKCDKCETTITEHRPMKDMDREDPCSKPDCEGTMKKVLNVGRVIRSQNVPNN